MTDSQMHDIDAKKAAMLFGVAAVKQMMEGEIGNRHISQGNLECHYHVPSGKFCLRQRIKRRGAIARMWKALGY